MRTGRGRKAPFPVALLEPAEMAEADRLTMTALSGTVLMQHAGEAVAESALRLIGVGGRRRVVVLCGPGNNGGDGYVAARLLVQAGCDVALGALGREGSNGDAAHAASLWTGGTIALADVVFDECHLVIDALFGAGLARELDGGTKMLVERLNAWRKASGRPVLAVDVPSGIDGASGQVRGTAVEASDTVTFFRLKPGHLLMPGRVHCGSLALADIGIDARVLDTIRPQTSLNQPARWRHVLPVPSLAGHKYARGHAVVVSGPIAQTGAARLCARGALRVGAGLVTVATPTDALAVHAAALTAIMTRISDGPEGLRALLSDPRHNAIVMGPGLGVGAATRALVLEALAKPQTDAAQPRSLVLDADALTSFVETPTALFDAIAASGHAVVLTPHDGEFKKLFGGLLDLTAAKPRRTREAAAMSGATLVLKGPDTVVASLDGRASIAASDAPWLATAGSGDVLAGIVTGLLAQGMPAFEAASAGVWMHAEAARLFGPGLISEDIPEQLPRVLMALYARDALAGM